jgi:hypothetical protein
MTRKQAVREIGDIVLRANMKPRTVKHALQLLKALLPPENTLPATVNELFGAMLSCKTLVNNDIDSYFYFCHLSVDS